MTDPSPPAAAPETLETRHTFCRICESLCGLEVDVDAAGGIRGVRPDPDHVETEGFACIKGLKQHRLYGSKDRLRHPMKRIGDRFEPITWAQALREIGDKVQALRGAHGADSIGMYVGTAAGFSLLHPIFAQGFMTGLGSRSIYSSATQDCSNKFAVARELYGFPFTQPFPDLDHTRCLIIVGANPVVSNGAFSRSRTPAADSGSSRSAAATSGSSTRAAPRPRRSPADTCRSARARTSSSTSRSSRS